MALRGDDLKSYDPDLPPPVLNDFKYHHLGRFALSLWMVSAFFHVSLVHLTARRRGGIRPSAGGGAPKPTPANLWVHLNTFLLPLAFFFESTPAFVGPVDAGSMSLAAWLPSTADPPGLCLLCELHGVIHFGLVFLMRQMDVHNAYGLAKPLPGPTQ